MSITVGDNFQYLGGKPLDSRLKFATVAAMKAFAEASLYDGCFAYITENKKYYTYDSSNTVDSTTGKWREFESGGGASALSDLTDTNISTPTDGQVLQYDGTNDEWVNGDAPKGVVQGYAYEKPSTSLTDIIISLNQLLQEENFSVTWTNRDTGYEQPSAFLFLYNEAKRQCNIWAFNNGIDIQHDSNSNNYSLRSHDGDSIVGTTGSVMFVNITNGVANFAGSFRADIDENWGIINYAWGWTTPSKVYYAGDVDLTNFSTADGEANEIDVMTAKQFYYDSLHTQLITPNTTTMYEDIPTDALYVWDGTAYVQTSGASGASALSDLTDTTITTPSNNDVLKYDSSSNKWVNGQAPSGASSMAELTDTTVTNPVNGQILKYNSTTQKWENTSNSSVNDVEITLADYNDLSSAEKNNGLNYFITDGQNAGYVFSVQKAVLSSGSTTVQFNVPTTGEPLLTLYTSDPNVQYLSADTSVAGVVTYTFGAQSNAIDVYLKIEVF